MAVPIDGMAVPIDGMAVPVDGMATSVDGMATSDGMANCFCGMGICFGGMTSRTDAGCSSFRFDDLDAVHFVATSDSVDDVHSFNHLAEDRIAAIQMRLR